MSSIDPQQLEQLEQENIALRKTVDVLVQRHESSMADAQSEFAFFEQHTQLKEVIQAQEAELGTARGMLDLAMRGASDGFWCYEPETDSAWYSARFLELLGMNLVEPDGLAPVITSMIERVHPDERHAVESYLRSHVQCGSKLDLRFRLRTERDGFRWFWARGRALGEGDGKAERVAGSIQDIHKEIEIEKQLLESERFAHAILDGQVSPTVIVDSAGAVILSNRAWDSFLKEFREGSSSGSGCNLFTMCSDTGSPYGADSEEVAAIVRAVLSGHRVTESFLHRASRGHESHFSRVVVTPVEQGDRRLAILTHYDVTEEFQRQAALAKAHKEIQRLALVAQHTDNGVIITDDQSRVEWVNDAFTRITGYKSEDVIGKLPSAFLSLNALDALADTEMRAGIDQHESFNVVIENRTHSNMDQSLAVEFRPILGEEGSVDRFVAVLRDVTEELAIKRRLDEERNLLESIISTVPYSVYWKDRDGMYLGCNKAYANSLGLDSPEELIGLTDFDMPWSGEHSKQHHDRDLEVARTGKPLLHREEMQRDDAKSIRYIESSKIPLRGADGEVEGVLGILADITDRKVLEAQLVQAQKLESIGQLAAGIAHEINTPTQYVADNTRFLKDEFANLIAVIEAYQVMLDKRSEAMSWAERSQKIERMLAEVDYGFLKSEIPEAITQSLEGIERITHIVSAMKDFSHPGASTKELTDLNKAISSTVTVCRNRWKYAADLELKLDPQLPLVLCLLGEFNQVILNLVVNAADAIESRYSDGGDKGRIVVETELVGSVVEVRVSDNGPGIPDLIRDRIFDPFFTTKEVGKGTGQGLAISRDVIVQKHGGEISCRSEPEVGTTFIIRIPLEEAGIKQLGRAA